MILAILVLSSYFTRTALTKNAGSPGGYTGSNKDGRTCGTNGGCHGGGATAITNAISTNIPSEGYRPDSTYTITYTVSKTNINEFGFESMAENSLGSITGSFIITNSTETKGLATSTRVTHKSAGTPGAGTKTWSVNWKAPNNVDGGDITFFAAFIASNNNNNDNGDQTFTSSLKVSPAFTCNNLTLSVSKSDASSSTASDGSIVISALGGEPDYSFLWADGNTSSSLSNIGIGNYDVTVTDKNDCKQIETISIGVVNYLSKTYNSSEELVLKNPIFCGDKLIFTKGGVYRIFSAKGELVYIIQDSNNQSGIPILNSGMYFVVSENQTVQKIMVL